MHMKVCGDSCDIMMLNSVVFRATTYLEKLENSESWGNIRELRRRQGQVEVRENQWMV